MQIETVETIESWSIATFGTSPNFVTPLSRTLAEIGEMVMVAAQPVLDTEKLAMECADVAITLCRPAGMLGIKIDEIWNAQTHKLQKTGRPLSTAIAIAGHAIILMARMDSKASIDVPEVVEAIKLIVRNLFELCVLIGVHLGHVVSTKMQINRERQWKIIGAGMGRHVNSEA